MSGFVVMWNLDGRLSDPPLLRRMLETIAHRGPDRRGYWADQSVALSHCMLQTTPESLHEIQPLFDEAHGHCLTLDGRVDNREELAAALKRRGIFLRADTDADLVLGAYACWGQDCPQFILGDFAFVIWDGRNRRLFCARDAIGCRPLYYYKDDRLFLCASELPPFFLHPAVRRECNEEMIGEYLANAITSREETLFRNIWRLPPAHSLTVDPQRTRMSPYWQADSSPALQYRSAEDYAEQFQQVFQEAVRARLRSQTAVGVELSGGLDSSSVVGMAQSLFHAGRVADRGFEAFSLIFPGLHCDESLYINEVVQRWGLKSNVLCPEDMDRTRMLRQVQRHLDFPDYPNHAMSDQLYLLAREKGFRAMLTGLGGDEWLGEGFPPYADLLCQGKWLSFMRTFRKDPDTSVSIVRELLATLLPQPARRICKRILGRGGPPPWIDPIFAHRIQLMDRLRARPRVPAFRTYVQRDLLLAAQDGERAHVYDMTERSSSAFGVELRHPFNDRRFIEFALALPDDQRYHGPQVKVVLRRAMAELLPERVRMRRTKADFSPVFRRAFPSLGGAGLFKTLTGEGRWVDGERVRWMFGEMQRSIDQNQNPPAEFLWALWRVLGIELWYHTVFLNEEWSPELDARRSFMTTVMPFA